MSQISNIKVQEVYQVLSGGICEGVDILKRRNSNCREKQERELLVHSRVEKSLWRRLVWRVPEEDEIRMLNEAQS